MCDASESVVPCYTLVSDPELCPASRPNLAVSATGEIMAVWEQAYLETVSLYAPYYYNLPLANRYLPGLGWDAAPTLLPTDVPPHNVPQGEMVDVAYSGDTVVAVWLQADAARSSDFALTAKQHLQSSSSWTGLRPRDYAPMQIPEKLLPTGDDQRGFVA
jgi:hypothetical protein